MKKCSKRFNYSKLQSFYIKFLQREKTTKGQKQQQQPQQQQQQQWQQEQQQQQEPEQQQQQQWPVRGGGGSQDLDLIDRGMGRPKKPPLMPGDDSAIMELKRKRAKEDMRQAYYEHLVSTYYVISCF